MSQDSTQETVSELTAESQSKQNSGSNEDSKLLHEVMQKKEKLQKAVEERDTLKSELDSINSKIKKDDETRKIKELEEKGEYQKIIDDMTIKLETAESDQKEWLEFKAKRREDLLSKLPEDDREIYNKLPLSDLDSHVKKVSKASIVPGVDNSSPLSAQAGNSGDWTKLNEEERKKNWTEILNSYKK